MIDLLLKVFTQCYVSSYNASPSFHQVVCDPRMYFTSQPVDVVDRIIALSFLSILIRGAAHINNVNQSMCVSQIVQELVAEALTF